MKAILNKYLDSLVIIIGCLTLLLSFIGVNDDCLILLIVISSCIVLYYFVRAVAYLFKRPLFDWHLIYGNFLRKICCLILLMPIVLTGISMCLIESPKDLCQDSTSCIESPNFFWTTYFHFIDPGNQHMTTTPEGRRWSAIIAILGVFLLNGLLVSSLVGWIDSRKEKWLKGEVRYKRSHLGKYRYAVVIGANEIAASVITNLLTPPKVGEISYKCEGNNKYVVLQTSRDVELVRSELASHLSEKDLKKVIIYKALRDSEKELEKLYIEYSTEIYVLGESTLIDGGETYHDAMNMRCVNLIANMLEKTKNKREKEKERTSWSAKKVCKVMFEYQTTASIFQFSDVSQTIKNNLNFIPFNRYESWARKVMVDGLYKDIQYIPLEGNGIPEKSLDFVHFVIVGMSKMGIAMGVEALLQAHYLNSEIARTRITFIDSNADLEMAFFKGRYANLFELIRNRYIDTSYNGYDIPWDDPMKEDVCKWKHLSEDGENFLDVEIEFLKGKIESEGVRNCLKRISDDKSAKLTIAICLTHTHQAIASSLYLPIEVYKNDRLQQIWVYQRESEDIISNLNNECNDLRYKKLRPFGMLYGEYMSDRTLYLKALLVNTAYDIANGYNKVGWPNDISNKKDEGYKVAKMSWKKSTMTVDKKWSNKYYADSIYIKIRNILYNNEAYSSYERVKKSLLEDLNNTTSTIEKALFENQLPLAICEHNRWNVQQLLLGYSPCDEELDLIFRERNELGEDTEQVRAKYCAWKKNHLFSTELVENKRIKEDVKESALRVHPNICSYNHLSKVDSGAKKYDADLNRAIPKIISIVDGYKKELK